MEGMSNNELQVDLKSVKQEVHAMKENFDSTIRSLKNFDSRIRSLEVIVQFLKASIDYFLQQQKKRAITQQRDENPKGGLGSDLEIFLPKSQVRNLLGAINS